MLPNFRAQIASLLEESWEFQTENCIDFYSDLMLKSETFSTNIMQVHSRKEFNFSSHFYNVGVELRFFVRERRNVCTIPQGKTLKKVKIM